MKTDTPKTIYLKDYQPLPYSVQHIDLNFDIHEGYTIVEAKTQYHMAEHCREDLFLHGEGLDLMEVKIDGEETKDYTTDETGLTLACPHKPEFTLEIKTRLHPEENTRLEGLYKSGDTYCTQCEAEGFRRITYYPDRPDIMATFTTRIEASKEHYPVLLGNGNRLDHGDAEHGRHFAAWHDPFPKPCYLFALVAGDLTHIEDEFTTKSGRTVDLYIYVRPGDEGQCDHAMESLKKSMRWEEDVYGLEYDLDLFNIVAVSDFNMGAMENKSLNIFNTALVLAHKDTATDTDFIRVEGVIAHEYFHNWSGNRVTCRDWFQLSLKEGLTVFRDQEFSADMNSRAVQRIDDVGHLRRFQFSEDAGPLSHPIRPDNYIEINNFYTMTVYEKGAEIIRMMQTILGPENYRKGTDLYFKRHDGQAATCDDFVKAMEDASEIDLTHFKLWYSQAGTPEIHFRGVYNEDANNYVVEMEQKNPDTPGQKNKKPMHIPVRIGLLNDNGDDIRSETLHLTEEKQSFILDNIPSKPVPSVLRNFSAPVKLKAELSDDELKFLMVHDSDGFNKWEAGQTYFLRTLNALIGTKNDVPEDFLDTYSDLLDRALDKTADKALMARALSLPDIQRIAQEQDIVDPQAIHEAREKVLDAIVNNFKIKLEEIYVANLTERNFQITPEAMGQRVLQNTVMLIGANQRTDEDAQRAKAHYHDANNMTDRMAALHLTCALDGSVSEKIVADFHKRFKNYPLVVDKWFSAQAAIHLPKTIQIVKKLKQHPDFNIKNPNRVRSLYSAFAMMNPVRFHAADGSGYNFLTEAVIELNEINPQIAARLLTPMKDWKRYTEDRQDLMKAALGKIMEQKDLSPDVFEIVSKTLKA
ncbi:MAG: aminopeptidase N [Micavibrio sp.]|nr:MAG: aminopeptidase N [Micavibrio sp.]